MLIIIIISISIIDSLVLHGNTTPVVLYWTSRNLQVQWLTFYWPMEIQNHECSNGLVAQWTGPLVLHMSLHGNLVNANICEVGLNNLKPSY